MTLACAIFVYVRQYRRCCTTFAITSPVWHHTLQQQPWLHCPRVPVVAVYLFFDDSVDVARRRRDDVTALGPRDPWRRYAANTTRHLYDVRLIGRRCQSWRNVLTVHPLRSLCGTTTQLTRHLHSKRSTHSLTAATDQLRVVASRLTS